MVGGKLVGVDAGAAREHAELQYCRSLTVTIDDYGGVGIQRKADAYCIIILI